MTTTPTTGESGEELRQRLRELAHDMRTPLSVICMGLDALKLVRQDDEQFAQLVQMMTAEGTTPLKTMITSLGDFPADSR